MPKTNRKDCDGENCEAHPVLEFKTNLSMGMLGANLLGVILIASMVAWSLAKSIPEMEERLTSKITPLVERIAKLEQWKSTMEAKDR